MILQSDVGGGICLIGFAILVIIGVVVYLKLQSKKESEINKWVGYEYTRTCNKCSKVWYSDYITEKRLSDTAYKPGNINLRSANVVNREMLSAETELKALRKCPNCGSTDYKETGSFKK